MLSEWLHNSKAFRLCNLSRPDTLKVGKPSSIAFVACYPAAAWQSQNGAV